MNIRYTVTTYRKMGDYWEPLWHAQQAYRADERPDTSDIVRETLKWLKGEQAISMGGNRLEPGDATEYFVVGIPSDCQDPILSERIFVEVRRYVRVGEGDHLLV